jgi:Mg-chelatase subunit ChlD
MPSRDEVQRRRRGLYALGVLAAISSGTLQLAFGTPDDGWHWTLLGVGILTAALTAAAFDWIALTGRLPRLPTVRRRWLVIPTAVVGVLVGGVFAFNSVAMRVDRYLHGCPMPTQMTLLASPEGLGPARALAQAYVRATAEDDGCPTVNVYVYSASDATIRDALPTGWQADEKTARAPRPDVWLPDSTRLVEQVITIAATSGLSLPMDSDRPSMAASPIVIAVPAARSSGIRADRTGRSWQTLVEQVGPLVRPDPLVSTTGQLATAAIYDGIDAGAARRLESGLAHAASAGRFPLSDSLDQLCELRRRGAVDTAVITSEQTMVAFNRGDALGSCPAVDHVPTTLLAYYPDNTPALDHPVVVFDWHEADRPEAPSHQVAVRFRSWLLSGTADAALQAVGLRPSAAALGPPLSDEYGVVPNARYTVRSPTAEAVTVAMRRYAIARLKGRVLLALDTSGSMGNPVAGRRRIDVAAEGIRASLAQMGADDEFGLLVFPADDGVLVPVGPRDGRIDGQTRQQRAEQRLGDLPTAGNTPLAPAIITSVDIVGQSTVDDEIRAVVVLTDGEDTSGLAPSDVVSLVRDKGVRVFIVAVGEASCSGELLAGVTQATGGTCYPADFTTVADRLTKLFAQLWKGADDAV